MNAEQGYTLVTGSAGFIGTALLELLARRNKPRVVGLDIKSPARQSAFGHVNADIRSSVQLKQNATALGFPDVVIHLAAKAEAVTPFAEIPELIETNVIGTLNVLDAFSPGLCIFASSCAVYGNTSRAGVSVSTGMPRPVGLYGDTKATGEMILKDWVRETGKMALAFRFGNVIGSGCRGLIPYLVNHAKRFPDGDVPAQMRGDGKIIRDYVPVDYLINVIQAAAERSWKTGTFQIFNVGSGKGISNGEIAALTQKLLKKHGCMLKIDMRDPIANGEAHTAVLKVADTERTFGLKRPTASDVEYSVEDAVTYWWHHAPSAIPTSSHHEEKRMSAIAAV